jgi:benzylsuccinate CoA-transferase BbsF subunit
MNNNKPLQGLKILDFTTIVMGPASTRILSDCGAEVIKVESSTRTDTLRSATPYKGEDPSPNRSGYFALYNAGKLSLPINMRKPESIEFVKEHLVPWADVIVTAFTPRVLPLWGMTYSELSAIKPELIMLSACLMGNTGPYADLRGTGQLAAALSGWYENTGWADKEPVGPYSAYADFVSWNYFIIAVMAALDYRDRTGKGQYIDQSMFESTLQFAGPQLMYYLNEGKLTTRMGNEDPDYCPHNTFQCKGDDNWCSIVVQNDKQWEILCSLMGNHNLFGDNKYNTLKNRKQNEKELNNIINNWTKDFDSFELMYLLQTNGVAAGVVQNPADLFQDPQLRHRDHFVVRSHQDMGYHHILTPSFIFKNSDRYPNSAAPLLGEHLEFICKEILDIPDNLFAELISKGVLE